MLIRISFARRQPSVSMRLRAKLETIKANVHDASMRNAVVVCMCAYRSYLLLLFSPVEPQRGATSLKLSLRLMTRDYLFGEIRRLEPSRSRRSISDASNRTGRNDSLSPPRPATQIQRSLARVQFFSFLSFFENRTSASELSPG